MYHSLRLSVRRGVHYYVSLDNYAMVVRVVAY